MSPTSTSPAHPAPRRFRAVTTVAVASLVLAGAGFAAGRMVQAPVDAVAAQVLDDVPVFAEAITRPMGRTATLTGTIGALSAVAVPAFVPAGTDQAVVTAAPVAVGSPVTDGTVVTEISGRPVIAAVGDVLLYRDLLPGTHGQDVEQVQTALKRLGHYRGAVHGRLDPATQAALTAWYRAAQRTPPPPSADSAAALVAAQEALAAFRAEPAAEPGAADEGTASSAGERGAQERRLREAVSDAQVAAGPWLPRHEWLSLSAPGVLTGAAARGTVLEAGTEAATVRTGDVAVVARADAAQVELFAVGGTARVKVPGLQAEPFDGTVSAVSEFRPAASASDYPGYDVTVSVPDLATAAVTAGSAAEVTATADEQELLAVPLNAVRRDDDGQYLLVAEPDGDVATVRVEIARESEGWAGVTTGPSGQPSGLLAPGARVRVVP